MNLFEPLTVRDVTFRNRIFVSPMCQYSSIDGLAADWHLVHLGSRAVGGAGLVFTEAAAVEARGRISPSDLGIYDEKHIDPLQRITSFIHEQGSIAGIQIAHAGRKASTAAPWLGGKPLDADHDGWNPIVGPSPLAFDTVYQTPHALTELEIGEIVKAFGDAAKRSLDAGFQVIELHAAHGYLLHAFYSPLSNNRTDRYGDGFSGRTRIVREAVEEIRRYWPEKFPLFMRISATDWTPGGWDIEQSVELARQVKSLGVDLIDVSSGGNVPHVKIPVGPGYQTGFAEKIRKETGMMTAAVGMITSPAQAQHILQTGQADAVLLARELLRDPYWPRRAAKELGQEISAPDQYGRAW